MPLPQTYSIGVKGNSMHPLLQIWSSVPSSCLCSSHSALIKQILLVLMADSNLLPWTSTDKCLELHWILQLAKIKELDFHLKEHYTQRKRLFKDDFCLWTSGCGQYLSASDGHDWCLMCLGCTHTESAFVDGGCSHGHGDLVVTTFWMSLMAHVRVSLIYRTFFLFIPLGP